MPLGGIGLGESWFRRLQRRSPRCLGNDALRRVQQHGLGARRPDVNADRVLRHRNRTSRLSDLAGPALGNAHHLHAGAPCGHECRIIRRAVGDDHVDLGQPGDAHERDAAQLALVGRHDHPVGAFARRPLHPAFGLVVVGDAAIAVDSRDTHHVGVAVVVGESVFGGRPDQAQLTRAQLATGEHDGGVRFVDQLQRGEHARADDRQTQVASLQ